MDIASTSDADCDCHTCELISELLNANVNADCRITLKKNKRCAVGFRKETTEYPNHVQTLASLGCALQENVKLKVGEAFCNKTKRGEKECEITFMRHKKNVFTLEIEITK